MSGTLYLVATPIGNLGDLSPRAADTLARADFIAAEDTRVTRKLLSHLGLKKPVVSYHEHNKAAARLSPRWPSAACLRGGSSSRGSCL